MQMQIQTKLRQRNEVLGVKVEATCLGDVREEVELYA